ncbi:HelD family protein [Microbispora catharanthi]|uniref:HelD family protein n=1 Tax=Microbispora catharanthi TaxID=1712871 RepID=UPI001378590F|nr:AAA family ATPase [Microbispora catharanthi]
MLKAEQAAVDHAYDCYDRQQSVNEADMSPPRWDQNDPESGTAFISEAAPELRDAYPDLGRESLVFMRVDIQERDDDETFYIGRRTVKDLSTDQRIVINWSSPAAIRWSLALPSDPGEVRLRRHLRCDRRRVLGYTDDIDISSAESVVEVISAGKPQVSAAERDANAPPAAGMVQVDKLLLQELDRARDGKMRDIVETIKRDQLMLVADQRRGVLVVQGGPGTGKTAVGLHRVTWLLNPENKRFKPQDVLVIGPNKEFLNYVGSVLPRLGNRNVTIISIDRLWGSEAQGRDTVIADRVKSDLRMARVLRKALDLTVNFEALRSAETGRLTVQLNGAPLVVPGEEIEKIFRDALASPGPFWGRRNKAIDLLVDRLLQTYAEDQPKDRLPGDVRSALKKDPRFAQLLNTVWPAHAAQHLLRQLYSSQKLLAAAAEKTFTEEEQQSLRRPQSQPFTAADLVLLDELEFLLKGEVPRLYRHLVIDEAQDLTPMQARALKRRCPSGSMTVLGDLAQTTGPHVYRSWDLLAGILAGQEGWSLAELTVGYRVPKEVLDFAAPLAAAISPTVPFPTSIRQASGTAVSMIPVKPWELLDRAIAQALNLIGTDDDGEQSRSIVLIVPDNAEWIDEVKQRLTQEQQQHPSRHAQAIRILPAALTKGLEFDHVILLDPASIADQGPTGLHQLYVAITRCTQSLTIVHTAPLPAELLPGHNKGSSTRKGRQCSRFHANGRRCTHITAESDGWCREEDCAGYRQSTPTGPTRYSHLKIPFGADLDAQLTLSSEQLRRVRVSVAARNQFVEQHGGEEIEAEVELRAMLGDFLQTGRHIRQGDYWLLDQDGYRLVLSSDGGTVTAYRTVHADRSYAQYKAGIPSRVSKHAKANRRSAFGAPRKPGGHITDVDQLRDIDVSAVHITPAAAGAFEGLVEESRDLPDPEFDAMLRQRLGTDLDRNRLVPTDHHFLVFGDLLTWIVTLDGQAIKSVRPHHTADLATIKLLEDNGGRLPTYLTDPDLLGTWVSGTVADPAGAGRFYLETDKYPPGQVILCLRGDDPVPSPGSELKAWVFQQSSDGLLVSVNEFGRVSISEGMRQRYLSALTVFDQLSAGSVPDAAERLSDLQSMGSRCLNRDQPDWLRVWEVLGRPIRARLHRLVALTVRAKESLTGETETHLPQILTDLQTSGWTVDLQLSSARLLNGDSAPAPTEEAIPPQGVPSVAAPSIEDPYLALLESWVMENRRDDVHERIRNELMVRLFRAGASPTDSPIVDVLQTGKYGTILYEVIGAGGLTYAALRDGAVHLKEVASVLDRPADHMFLVLPQTPDENWAIEKVSGMFGISIIWRTESGWDGQNVEFALNLKSA